MTGDESKHRLLQKMEVLTAPEREVLRVNLIFSSSRIECTESLDEAVQCNDTSRHLDLVAIREGANGSEDAE